MSAPPSPARVLDPFHPVLAAWFRRSVGEPTEVQARAWPVIAAGRHALVTAPTGSGKTLTAFLWALDRLLTGAWEGGALRVLYVSPLKALNNDIQRNLLGPLEELGEAFRAAGLDLPAVRVATRSGDTPQAERQRMVRRPPEILITTPESLNILLTSKGGRSILGHLETVILDEIHAVAGSKRGTHLITAVERLVGLSGEFQRLALSATVRPLERIARFVGGRRPIYRGEAEPDYRPRPVEVVEATGGKAYDLAICWPEDAPGPLEELAADARGAPRRDAAAPAEGAEPTLWDLLARDFKRRVKANRSTLLFANSRRLTEKVTRLLNEGERGELAWSHHGSLSREIRTVVEERLKEGRLAAIVATNSLELGIDIGALDEVLLIQTPRSVASALQRVGRAGHRVGEVSRARFYPTHARDFLDAAVVARAALDGAIEELRPVEAPLDVLAQVILSMTVAEEWRLDDLFHAVRAADPYRDLDRRRFDLVLEMLAGRYADTRLRELAPRVSIDRVAGTVRARPGAPRLLYTSGGTIPDRGYYHLRLQESMARIGELDEEFVWERSVGDVFTLGAQSWRIRGITHNDVLVTPAGGGGSMAPFWRADARDRGWELSRRIGELLERFEGRLAARQPTAEILAWLGEEHAMEEPAARQLLALLQEQRSVTGQPLPHRHHLLAELPAAARPDGDRQLILHTGWGGRVNRPLAVALAAAWERRHGHAPEIFQDDDALAVAVPDGFDPEELFTLLDGFSLEELLRDRLERTGWFGARFRIAAGTALLLPRADFRRRQPLWLIRQKAKKMLQAVRPYQEFPLVLETWRTCLEDDLELDRLEALLAELAAGEIRLGVATTDRPSPFAANLVWMQTNRLMYEDDTPEGGGGAGISADLLRELVFSSELRPRLPAGLIADLEARLQRTAPGYAPTTAADLLDHVKERIALPREEWRRLLEAAERDGEVPAEELVEPLADRLVTLWLRDTGTAEGAGTERADPDPRAEPAPGVVVAVELVPRLLAALAPRSPARLHPVAGAAAAAAGLEAALEVVGLAPHATDDGGLAAGPVPGATADREADEADAALEQLLAEWARFYGPFSPALPRTVFALPEERFDAALESLVDDHRWVVDRFRADEEAGREICDAENLERLLRMLRAAARPSFEALPLERLPLFLAAHQGLLPGPGGRGRDDLPAALEPLLGYPAPARSWEEELLPARLDPYYTAWLDALLQDTELLWFGCGRRRISFAFPSELELLRDAEEEGAAHAGEVDEGDEDGDEEALDEENGEAGQDGEAAGAAAPPAEALFPDPRGRFRLDDLAEHAGLPRAETERALWRHAWEGRVTTAGMAALRRGILARFRPSERPPSRRAAPRGRRGLGRRDRWRAPRSESGAWRLLPSPEEDAGPADALEREELARERARLLLDRYGVLFRELLQRELPALGWGRLFRSLRLMELSGEVLTGHFFRDVPGLQFASPAAFRRLRQGLPDDAIYWLSAVDPAAPCGLPLEPFQGVVPPRVPSTHLAFHGAELVVVSRRRGRDLEIRVAPEHPALREYLRFLDVLLTRAFRPLGVVVVETVNDEPAAGSPYATAIAAPFAATREAGSLKLRRRYE